MTGWIALLWSIALATPPAWSGATTPPPPDVPVDCNLVFKANAGKKIGPVKFDIIVEPAFPVQDQGITGACWTVEGAEQYTAFFRQHGWLKPNQRLSYEFYYHAQMASLLDRSRVRSRIRDFMPVDAFLLKAGAYETDFFSLIQQHGLVLEEDYQNVDKLLNGTKFGSQTYRSRLISAVKKIRRERTWADARAVFLDSIGDIDLFKSNEVLNAQGFKPLEMMRKNRGGRPVGPIDSMLDGIQASLDADLPIVIDIDINWTVMEQLSRKETSVGLTLLPGSHDDNHAVIVLGYALGADGKIQYLLVRNSWGKGWGKKGYVILDRPFLERYLTDLTQFAQVRGFQAAWERFSQSLRAQ